MKYPYTHRKAIPFCFLNFITFGIYGCVVLSRVDQEMNHLVIGFDDYKTTPRYWPWYVLGWATFMIAPFVWQIRLASKLGGFAKEMKVGSPRLSGLSFAMWSTFGTLILVGPFIAWHRVFSLLNFLEDAANHESEVRELAKIKSQNGEPNVLFASMEEVKRDETPKKDPNEAIISFAHSNVKEESQEESFTPLETNSESKVAELPPLTEEEQLLHRYSSYPEGPFKVRFESGRLLRGFAAKEVAIAFSKELAEIKDVRVRYRKKRQ